jgi:hypothetical protein
MDVHLYVFRVMDGDSGVAEIRVSYRSKRRGRTRLTTASVRELCPGELAGSLSLFVKSHLARFTLVAQSELEVGPVHRPCPCIFSAFSSECLYLLC